MGPSSGPRCRMEPGTVSGRAEAAVLKSEATRSRLVSASALPAKARRRRRSSSAVMPSLRAAVASFSRFVRPPRPTAAACCESSAACATAGVTPSRWATSRSFRGLGADAALVGFFLPGFFGTLATGDVGLGFLGSLAEGAVGRDARRASRASSRASSRAKYRSSRSSASSMSDFPPRTRSHCRTRSQFIFDT